MDINIELCNACRYGDLQQAKLMISKGANNWNDALYNACRGAYLRIIKLLSKYVHDWNYGLYGACSGGHLGVVELMITNGASNWDLGLSYASQGGKLKIIKLMISKGATNWNDGLTNACYIGKLEIVKLMISKGADNLNHGLYIACNYNHLEIIKFLILKGANHWTEVTVDQLFSLLEHGNSKSPFDTIPKYEKLFLEIKLFRHLICSFAKHLLIPDLLNLVSDYSLK